MSTSGTTRISTRHGWTVVLLLGLALLLAGVRPAHAQGSSTPCFAGFGGVINGNVMPVPNNVGIDGRCTIENYQDAANSPNGVASPNGDYTGNITLLSTSDLLILSNVDFDGNVSCEVGSSHPTVFYLLNSEVDAHQLQCMRKQGTVAQIDKIDKSIPSGQTTAAIGVPFTYALTFPQQCAPPIPTNSCPSVNPNGSTDIISQVTITDDLNATGVSLTYLSSVATWKGSTCPAPGAPVPFTGPAPNSTGLLTFSGFPTIPAACQVVVDVTVVLNNAVPPNSPGTQFVNTANWTLGTTLGGQFFFPLPGMPGVSPPLTIATPPALTLTKGGPATMNIGQLGRFTLNVQNTGTSDAWNATIVDKLPTGATGGMCAAAPQILSAQVFQADGVTPVPGKGPLTAGTDYTVTWAGPACTLTINLLSAAADIGPSQRLIVTYQTQLDANTQNGATLTNVAGATQWYNGPSSAPGRQSYTCTLTNGTPGVLDCQDAHTVTVAISAVTITKQVTVVGNGPPVPGATLQYLVHVTNTSASPVSPVVITDDLNAAGAGALTYVAGTATMNGSANGVSVAGNVITASYSATYGPLAPGGTIDLRFRATLGSTLAAGALVTNTGVVTWGKPAQSASGSVSVQVVAPTPPTLTLTKGGPATLNLGQSGRFTLNVQNVGQTDAWNAVIVDKLPTGATGGMCAAAPQILSAQVYQADGVTPVPGKGPLAAGTDYTVSFAGAPACTLTINLLSAAAVIGPTQRLVLTYQTQLDANTQKGATLTNVAGATQWYSGPSSSSGRQSYTCALTNGTPGVLDCQDAHTVTVPISAVTLTKAGPATMYLGQLGQFTLNVQNTGTSDAWNATIVDKLPSGATGGMCAAAPQILSAQVFQTDGVTPVAGKGPLVAGTDYTVTWAGPACTLTINLLSAAAVISPTQRLIVIYQTRLDANSQLGATLTNVAGATQWYDGPSSNTGRQSSTCTLTNGTPGVLDCQDAHTVTVSSATVNITKSVTVVGGGMAAPGATLQYLVHVTNNSPNPVSPLVITDDLNAAGPGALTYLTGTATVNGSVTGVTATGNVITVNYSATYGPLAAGGTIDLSFRATLGSTLATGTTITNTGVVTWGNPSQSASASVSIQLDTPPGALTVSKTTPLVQVTRGQLIPYTITVTNVLSGMVQGVALVDSFPAGFRYMPGSARIDGTPAEPTLSGFTLTWSNLSFAAGAHHTVVLLLAVGAGVGEGQFVNRAQAFDQVSATAASRVQASAAGARAALHRAQVAPALVLGNAVSSEGSATVVVVPDTTFDCTDVIGKVFDDRNGNGQQEPGEPGIPGVRVVTTRGLAAVTDEFGRFHITCAITPLEGRGSNFALKLDDRTLPSGYRLTTPEVLVERATRGKALRFEFGASIHRVVSLDLSDAVFEPNTADMRPQWQPRLELLLTELRKSRSVLRLSYVADVEERALVDRRLEAVTRTIRDGWRALNCCYELTIESEVFWLRGGPPKEPVERLRGAK